MRAVSMTPSINLPSHQWSAHISDDLKEIVLSMSLQGPSDSAVREYSTRTAPGNRRRGLAMRAVFVVRGRERA